MAKDNLSPENVLSENFAVRRASQEHSKGPGISYGSLQLARVIRTDLANGKIFIKILEENKYTNELPALYPGFMSTPDGSGIWHGLSVNDTVLIGYGHGNNPIILNKINNAKSVTLNVHELFGNPTQEPLAEDEFAIRSRLVKGSVGSGFMSINCVPNKGISVGMKPFSSLNFDFFPETLDSDRYYSAFSIQTGQSYCFTESGYHNEGIIFRTLKKPGKDILDVRNQDKWYKNLSPICMDPSRIKANATDENRIKNPPFVENKTIIYEFADGADVESDSFEEQKQNVQTAELQNNIYTDRQPTSRRDRKYDILSLSLVYPNHLIESVSGTLVDVYGNILDLNRHKIPVGRDQLGGLEGDAKSYRLVRKMHRRGVAHHWELNARKDPDTAKIETGNSDSGTEYGTIDDNYGRDRSRFHLDIDKEGQFKLNVPASSETGNVALLTRHENVSTTRAPNDDYGADFNTFLFPEDGSHDIRLDSFGNGSITLDGNEKMVPNDRFDGKPIKLGTVFHDISKTCCEPKFEGTELDKTGLAIFGGPDSFRDTTVTSSLIIDGIDANAGGRSGTLAFDGMMSCSIGANTVDRQSLWLDTAGGAVMRLGRDKEDVSLYSQMDGHVFIQMGGNTIDNDSRFTATKGFNNTANINTTLEIRVITGNNRYHRIFLDEQGIVIKSASDISLEASGNCTIQGAQIVLNGEVIQKYTQAVTGQEWKEPIAAKEARAIAAQDVYSGGIDGEGTGSE